MVDKNRQKLYSFYMKKFYFWLIPLLLVTIISVGAIVGITIGKNSTTRDVFATKLESKQEKFRFLVGGKYSMTSNEIAVEPANCTQRIIYNTDNSSVMEIDVLTGKIFAKKIGNCNLIATIKSSETTNITIKIPVEVYGNTVDEKQEVSISKTFTLDEQDYGSVEYDIDEPLAECSFSITKGAEHLSYHSFDTYKTIFVEFASKGEVEIVVESQTKKITITINII